MGPEEEKFKYEAKNEEVDRKVGNGGNSDERADSEVAEADENYNK